MYLGQAGLHTSDLSEGKYAKQLSKAVMAALRQDWRRRIRPEASAAEQVRELMHRSPRALRGH
eukprot:COSAG05_NODE_442_length_9803_cov_28.091921_6_plen_63_part_00